jgi:hypothetical protein
MGRLAVDAVAGIEWAIGEGRQEDWPSRVIVNNDTDLTCADSALAR